MGGVKFFKVIPLDKKLHRKLLFLLATKQFWILTMKLKKIFIVLVKKTSVFSHSGKAILSSSIHYYEYNLQL